MHNSWYKWTFFFLIPSALKAWRSPAHLTPRSWPVEFTTPGVGVALAAALTSAVTTLAIHLSRIQPCHPCPRPTPWHSLRRPAADLKRSPSRQNRGGHIWTANLTPALHRYSPRFIWFTSGPECSVNDVQRLLISNWSLIFLRHSTAAISLQRDRSHPAAAFPTGGSPLSTPALQTDE